MPVCGRILEVSMSLQLHVGALTGAVAVTMMGTMGHWFIGDCPSGADQWQIRKQGLSSLLAPPLKRLRAEQYVHRRRAPVHLDECYMVQGHPM